MSSKNRRIEYLEEEALIERVSFLLHSIYAGDSVRADRPWTKREEFKQKLKELVDPYWEEFKPTKKEQERIDRAINSW